MAKNTKRPKNKMEGVREILKQLPTATSSEIAQAMKTHFNMNMSPKVAGTYRYHIQKAVRGKQRRAVKEAGGVPAGLPLKSTDGLDDLLHAANKLGWQRVKEIVDRVIGAPT